MNAEFRMKIQYQKSLLTLQLCEPCVKLINSIETNKI